jgi:REP element-mobilizing transposase RayT
MPIGIDTRAYHRCLPHLVRSGATYFVTFRTHFAFVVPESAREIVLGSCIHDHQSLHWLYCAVVMPDHVHLLLEPFDNVELSTILRRIKGASAHLVNALLGRHGHLWRHESFDHIVRSGKLGEKTDYICDNPVRRGLVRSRHDYRWLWINPEF